MNGIGRVDRKRLLRFLAARRVAGRTGALFDIFLAQGQELGELLASFLVVTADSPWRGHWIRAAAAAPFSPVTEGGAAVAAPGSDGESSVDPDVVAFAETERQAAARGRGVVDDASRA